VAVDDTLTLHGPASGWYIIRVRAGNPLVRWRLDRVGWINSSEERVGSSTFELRAGESVTIAVVLGGGGGIPTVVIAIPGTPTPTPRTDVLGTHTPSHRLFVAVDAVCQGVEITPIAPGIDDIKTVEFGIDNEGTDCPFSIPRVVFSFNPPGLPALNLDFAGVKVCFVYKRLRLGWGDFNVVDWAIPLFSLGIVWSSWLALRRG